jgi:hypothetical protein
MSVAERITVWNRWYDTVPSEWRFQFILWSLLALGTINMMLTVATGFPFALLVLLGIIVITAIRVPYILGMVAEPTHLDTEARFQVDGPTWLIDLNHRYEALPESRRLWVYPAVLLIAGAINMMLTIHYGFPFGLLFLFALLALVVFRAPYTAGWLRSPTPSADPAASDPVLVEPHSTAVEGPRNTHDGGETPESAPTELGDERPVEPNDREVKHGGE